jgi:hypothetical protein
MSRCDERLKARVEETCLTYTGLYVVFVFVFVFVFIVFVFLFAAE